MARRRRSIEFVATIEMEDGSEVRAHFTDRKAERVPRRALAEYRGDGAVAVKSVTLSNCRWCSRTVERCDALPCSRALDEYWS